MPIPLSLYVHIPWCVQKCPYCDFNSHAAKHDGLPEQEYVQRLLQDLSNDIDYFAQNRPLTSIFIGGGTPSLFSGQAIQALLDGVRQRLELRKDCEITLEANPGTVDEQHFADYLRAGVNRLSIGVQSFSSQQLQHLGRIHSPQQAQRAVKTAQALGFDNINIDLMFGLPQQTTNQAIADIEQGIALNTEHLSYYQLTLEPNTAFAKRPPILPPDEAIDERFDRAAKHLYKAGFKRYEVSAWSRGRQSKHNLNYWQYGDYLGIGAGAHGKITQAATGNIIRTSKPRSPKSYLQTQQLCRRRQVEENEKAFEFMLNSLRLTRGFPRQWLSQRGLVEETTVLPILQQLADKDLLTISDSYIKPTELGKHFVNDMVAAFLHA